MFARESVAQVIHEITPLLQLHWQEIAAHKDIPLHPDYERYYQAEAADALRIYTARKDGQLIGYAIFAVGQGLHYMTSRQAMQDLLFIVPAYRRGRTGWELIAFAEEQLKAEGTQVIFHRTKVAHDFGPLLERMGYTLTERVYSKKLH